MRHPATRRPRAWYAYSPTTVRWVVLFLIVACSGGDNSGTLAAIHERGKIIYGADLAGGEPYIYEDPADKSRVIGFEVDIMDAIARRLGVKAQMAQYAWSNLVPSLERGDFDIVMNGLEATAERRERILLSEPYYIYAETLTVKKGAPYKSLDDLKGKKVGTLNQTVAHDILRANPVDIALYEGNVEPYLDLEQGRLDAVLLDNVIAFRYGCTDEHPTLECLPDDVARGTYVIGIRKGDPELKKALDDAIRSLREDGELEKILRKAKLWDLRQTQAPPAIADDSGVRAQSFDLDELILFLYGALYTLGISLGAFLIAVPVGALLAVARVYGDPVSRALSRGYVELFRGTPVLLQLYVLYYGLAPVLLARADPGRGDRPRPQLRSVRGGGLSRRAARDPARPDRGGEGARPRPVADRCGTC